MKLNIPIILPGIVSVFLLITGCRSKSPFTDIDSYQKETRDLLFELEKQLLKDEATTKRLLYSMFKSKSSFEPLSIDSAKKLFALYDQERATRYTDQILRGRYHKPDFRDTRSITVPADSLFNYALNLIGLGKRTGVRIVFAGYPYDNTVHNPSMGRREQTKSGQLSVFFVATIIDSVVQTDGTYKYWHRDTIFTQTTSEGIIKTYNAFTLKRDGYVYNHGDLCPDSCGVTDFR